MSLPFNVLFILWHTHTYMWMPVCRSHMRRTKGTFLEAGETSLCVIREDSANSRSKRQLQLGVGGGGEGVTRKAP